MTYKLAINEFTNNDDSLGFLSSENDPYTFMSVESFEKTIEDQDDYLPNIEFRLELADTLHESERQVYTVFTMIGDIGGFNGAIIILPSFLMAQYSGAMYTSAIQEEIPSRKQKKIKQD